MPFTETLEALGSWELELAAETPADTLAQVRYLGHVVIVDGPVDVEATGNALLAAARYVGVCRAKANPGTFTRTGSGQLFWISDEDGKGHTILTEISLTNATLAQVVAALLPPTVTVGTVYAQANPATRYTGKHVFQSRRDALAIALAPFGAELRVNGDFTVDVGTPAQLYNTVLPLTSKPSPMIVRRGVGSDVDLVAVAGAVETEGAAWDLSTDIQLLGQTIGTGDEPDTLFATGSASAASPYKDPQGNPFKAVRLISESGQTTGSVAARAQLQLNRFNRETTAIKVTAEDFEISGGFGAGDATYVYDPDSGIIDTANQVPFRGETVYPQVIRVSSLTTPIVEGMTVAWRTDTGVWIDLTRWVVWESAGSREVTVGDLPKSLTRPSDPIQDRVDAGRGGASTKVPKAPTGLALESSSTINAKGVNAAVITAAWSAVTQYVDNTTVALSHYEVQSRPAFRAPAWQAGQITSATTADLQVAPALVYDVQVRAWSTGGIPSAWSSVASITSAADTTGPPAPADPTVTNVLGSLRYRYAGTTSTGTAMPSDANRVEFEVASSSTGPWKVENQVSPFTEGIHYVSDAAGYGQQRYVRLRAFDHNGNPSPYSGTVAATLLQAADGDISQLSVGKLVSGTGTFDLVLAGRITTALTGARVEHNALGFQKFAADNSLLVSITGTEALLTGIYKSALSGRRIEMGAAGNTGSLVFYAPDNIAAYVRAFTSTMDSSAGVEAVQMTIPIAGAYGSWNSVQVQENESTHITSGSVSISAGGASDAGSVNIYFARDKGNATTRPTKELRAAFFDDAVNIYQKSDGFFAVRQYLAGSTDGTTAINRLQVTPTALSMRVPAMGGNARLEVNEGDIGPNGASSPGLKMFTTFWPQDGLTYGLTLKAYRDGGGQRLEVRDINDNVFQPIWASAFTVQSTGAVKDQVTPLAAGALGMVQAMRPKTYRRKLKLTEEAGASERGRVEIGLLAEEMPDALRVGEDGGMVDLYGLVVTAIAAIQELAHERGNI